MKNKIFKYLVYPIQYFESVESMVFICFTRRIVSMFEIIDSEYLCDRTQIFEKINDFIH